MKRLQINFSHAAQFTELSASS